ncbi:MAG: alpha-amylase family glycosyl hydrolase [Ardenticatenia bacterium]|nr:alpha-amylase family glycosyl hydrolase [Ardenticatenia bacterium]
MRPEDRLRDHLAFLYGPEQGRDVWRTLQPLLDEFRRRNPHVAERVPPPAERLTERDTFLITYADQVREPGCSPLSTLGQFLRARLAGIVAGVHLLPFFPYSSDDGFSVIDYYRVDPRVGTWDEVTAIGRHFRLMFDAVINHVSRQSAWFQAFLRGEFPYTDYFIVVDPSVNLSQVVRPRTSPLLTPVETAQGVRYVWTTFSSDQIDLNYHNPAVLLEIVKVLLFYVEQGAEVIRLDAIAYLWKELGTPCIHLPQTHHVVKLFRALLDAVAPGVILITETNVPHEDNISYFGDGTDEAQMVYNFALPPPWWCTPSSRPTPSASRLGPARCALHRPPPPSSTSWPPTTASA